MLIDSAYRRVNGLTLFVHRFREPAIAPSGLTVLMVHGFLDSGATWDLVAPYLTAAGHEVIAPDLRGFGRSERVGAGGYYHFADYVADIAELVDAIGPSRLAVVGHSMGGTIAALYAGTRPDKVARLALLEGMGPMQTEPALAVDRMRGWLRDLERLDRTPRALVSLQETIERLALHHPRVSREVLATRAALLTQIDDQGRLVWAYDPLHRTLSPTPFNAEVFKVFLREIACPTLVVSGGTLGWHAPDEAERIACLRRPLHCTLPTAGHMMHWTASAELGAHLCAFFAEPADGDPEASSPSPSVKR